MTAPVNVGHKATNLRTLPRDNIPRGIFCRAAMTTRLLLIRLIILIVRGNSRHLSSCALDRRATRCWGRHYMLLVAPLKRAKALL